MKAGWLLWEDSTLSLKTAKEIIPLVFLGQISKEMRDVVCMSVSQQWQLAIPTEKGPCLWVSSNGRDWKHTGNPSLNTPSEANIVLEARLGQAAIVEPGWVHIFDGDTWNQEKKPKGAGWAGLGRDGSWWVVGAQSSTRIKTADHEVAAWKRDTKGAPWKRIEIQPASWWQGVRTIARGGFGSLSAIDAMEDPLILASECEWFADDPSWFVFRQREDGRFHIQRLPRIAISSIERSDDGEPFIITTDGDLWEWEGKRWKSCGVAKSLSRSLLQYQIPTDQTVSLAIRKKVMAAVVTVWRKGKPAEQLALQSDDRGRSWSLILRSVEGQRFLAPWVQ